MKTLKTDFFDGGTGDWVFGFVHFYSGFDLSPNWKGFYYCDYSGKIYHRSNFNGGVATEAYRVIKIGNYDIAVFVNGYNRPTHTNYLDLINLGNCIIKVKEITTTYL